MFKIASLVWIVLGTTLAGIALVVVLVVPELAKNSMLLIPVACIGAAVVALPISAMIAKRIQAQTARGR